MDIDHIDTYPAGTVVNFQHSEGSAVLAEFLGPSERGADYRSITFQCSGTVVTHTCAPIRSGACAKKDRPDLFAVLEIAPA